MKNDECNAKVTMKIIRFNNKVNTISQYKSQSGSYSECAIVEWQQHPHYLLKQIFFSMQNRKI